MMCMLVKRVREMRVYTTDMAVVTTSTQLTYLLIIFRVYFRKQGENWQRK